MIVEAVAIGREGGRVERFFARLPIDKPAVEPVGADAFAELPFAANRVKGHEEQRFEQTFGRHAGQPVLR